VQGIFCKIPPNQTTGNVDQPVSMTIKSTEDVAGNRVLPEPVTINHEQPEDSRDSQLLSLPAEIRVIIYKYVLISNGDIGMVNYAHQPRLLQTNKQVRNEALDLYYKENIFNWRVQHYDALAYLKWCRSSPHRQDACVTWHFHGKRRWDNLF
jgi:hypothetical protein